MAQISEITVEDLLREYRFDAEYYQPDYLLAENLIENYYFLDQVADTYELHSNGAFKDIFQILHEDESKEIPYIRSENVGSFFIEGETAWISKKAHIKLKKTITKEGDILTARTGKVGGASIVTDNFIGSNSNQNVVNIRIKDKIDIFPAYLLSFLNCKYGFLQFERASTGNVQPWLNLSLLRKVRIPKVDIKFQEVVKSIIEKAYQQKTIAESLYCQAEQLLLQELGLEDFTPQWVAGYETDCDNILEVARMDAEYFQPRYEIVKEKIRAVDHDILGNLVKPLKKGIEVGSEAYTDEGIPFLRVSNIEKLRIDNSSEQYIDAELYEELKDKFCPKKGEILLSKDGTPGIAYHLTEDVKTIISGGIVRLKTIDIEPEYLTLVLNSLIVQAQIEQDAGGALIKHWRPDQIKKTLIPIVPKTVREKIVSMVQDSFSALHESRQLLEQAKREVEEMIESRAA